jgi:hypothetical protein
MLNLIALGSWSKGEIKVIKKTIGGDVFISYFDLYIKKIVKFFSPNINFPKFLKTYFLGGDF